MAADLQDKPKYGAALWGKIFLGTLVSSLGSSAVAYSSSGREAKSKAVLWVS